MGSKNPFRKWDEPPPFKAGDFVTPLRGKRCYAKWYHGEFREIHSVIYDESQGLPGTWVLVIYNPLKGNQVGMSQYSKYNPENFTKESHLLPSVDNISLQVRHKERHMEQPNPVLHAKFIALRQISPDDYNSSEAPKYEAVTGLRDTLTEVASIVEADLNAGETIFIMKTVVKLEGLPPRPPVRRTEFR